VAASTQHGELHTLVFLYHYVLKQSLPELEGLEHAKCPRRLPKVVHEEELLTGGWVQ